MPTAHLPTTRAITPAPSTPTNTVALALFALTLVAMPSTAFACGDDGSFVFDVVGFLLVPLVVLTVGQGLARRFVSVRHHSIGRTMVALVGLGLATFGIVVGLAIGWSLPVLGAPLVVVELVYLLDMLVMLVAPRRPPLEAV
jgi:hypothetical protein